MPTVKLTGPVWARLKEMEKEEGYETHSSAIQELLHEHEYRKMPATSELSEGARADLKSLAEQYHDVMENVDALPQPMRDIAKFIKAVAAEGGSSQ